MLKLRAPVGAWLLLSALSVTILLSTKPVLAAVISQSDFNTTLGNITASVQQASQAAGSFMEQEAELQAKLAAVETDLAAAKQQVAQDQTIISTGAAHITQLHTEATTFRAQIDKLRAVAPPPTLSMSVDPSEIKVGEKSSLSWVSYKVESCKPISRLEGTIKLSGSINVSPTNATTYKSKPSGLTEARLPPRRPLPQ